VYPDDVKYTPEHEWLKLSGSGPEASIRVGITSYAQEALGDIVFVTLPEVGAELEAGQSAGEVESTKSVSDVYAPVAGTVVARNELLDNAPETLNADPYDEGWMFELRPREGAEQVLGGDGLLDAAAYAALVDGS
jgi:glycine cleavage system H protein